MPPPTPDRRLRRLVADLAVAPPEDIEQILADLDEGQRARVRALLADYLGAPTPTSASAVAAIPAPPAPPVGVASLAGLSPWLGARLARSVEPSLGITGRRRETRADAREPFMTFAMTSTALAALQAAARELQPAEETKPAERAPRLGWRDRLVRLGGLRP